MQHAETKIVIAGVKLKEGLEIEVKVGSVHPRRVKKKKSLLKKRKNRNHTARRRLLGVIQSNSQTNRTSRQVSTDTTLVSLGGGVGIVDSASTTGDGGAGIGVVLGADAHTLDSHV